MRGSHRIRPFALTRYSVPIAIAGLALAMLYGSAPPARATPASHEAFASVRLAGPQLPAGVARACKLPSRPQRMACMALVRTNTKVRPLGKQPFSSPPSGYGPADLQSAYNLASASASVGNGELVVLVDAFNDPNAASDLAVYRAQYGLAPCTTANGCFAQLDQNGAPSPLPRTDYGWAEEESLDLDMVSAICPLCHIDLIEANSNLISDLGTAESLAVTVLHAAFVSNSWGTRSRLSDAEYGSYFNHPGVAITFSAGDQGYGPSYPASSQYVTAVGGTTLSRASVSRAWIETAWRGTGSGCTPNGKPFWQADTGCAERTDNDVAAVADPNTGVAVYDSHPYSGPPGWQVLGGTSAAAPIIAATYALAGQPAAGSYPSLYPYRNPGDLYDVTSGSNGSCTPAYLCTAQSGYDGPTGLGTPDGTGAFALGPATGDVVTLVNPGPLFSAVGTPMTLQMQALDTRSGQRLSYSATSLPAGLTLDTSTGVISGTPTTPGTSQVTATATDGTGAASTVSFTWTTNDVITVQQPPTTYSNRGVPVSLQIHAFDSARSQTLTYSATGLPTGLTINAATGQISGAPTAFGRYFVDVTVADSATSASAEFTWYVHGVLTVKPPGQLLATAGDLVNIGVPATDTDPNQLTFTATGLPPDINMAYVGLIYGWLSRPGSYHVKVSVTDTVGATATVSFTWKVGSAPDTGPTGPIKLDLGDNCLAEAAVVSSGERRAEIRPCDGRADERWTVVQDNTLRLKGQCLGTVGAAAVLKTCTSGAASRWEVRQDGQVASQVSGQCLTDPGSSTRSGTHLVIAACNLARNQRWTEPPGPIISWRASRCLTYSAGTGVRKISLAPCRSNANQKWTVATDGTIRAAGECLMLPGGTAGPVDLQACGNKAGQSWAAVYPYEQDGWQLVTDGWCLGSPLTSGIGNVDASSCGSLQYVGDTQTWLVR